MRRRGRDIRMEREWQIRRRKREGTRMKEYRREIYRLELRQRHCPPVNEERTLENIPILYRGERSKARIVCWRHSNYQMSSSLLPCTSFLSAHSRNCGKDVYVYISHTPSMPAVGTIAFRFTTPSQLTLQLYSHGKLSFSCCIVYSRLIVSAL